MTKLGTALFSAYNANPKTLTNAQEFASNGSMGRMTLDSEESVRFCLVSQDRELYKLCQEILPVVTGGRSLLEISSTREVQAEADIFVWDYEPGMKIGFNFAAQNLRKHIFVVHRRDLDVFRDTIPFPEVSVLLKPVTRPALRAFLEQAISSDNSLVSDRIGSLRANRDQMLQQLIQSNLKLQEYDQERTNFLSRAVHDFRAPLTAVTGYCGLLLDEQLGSLSTEQKEVLERMQHSAKRLSRMANSMFQLSIGRQVEIRPNLQKNDIRECIEQALHETLPFTSEKNISVHLDITDIPEEVLFEMSQLEQVVINLLDNASKFTHRGGFIKIRGYPFFWDRRSTGANIWRKLDRRLNVGQEPNAFRVDIQDSGPGIPSSDLTGIFEEYTSYAGSQDRSGGGLGLAICKLIMTQHQGAIWADNADPGGAIFSFVLPLDAMTKPLAIETKLNRASSRTAGAL